LFGFISVPRDNSPSVLRARSPASSCRLSRSASIAGGCCCDYRRAVFVLAILGIIFDTLNLITSYSSEVATWLTTLGYVLGIVIAGVSFYGALKYNVGALWVQIAYLAIWFVISIVVTAMEISDVNDQTNVDLTTGQTVGALIFGLVVLTFFTALAMYPAVYLIKEIKAGIMTEATYAREAHSCCCSPV
jgi:hypothetical protein